MPSRFLHLGLLRLAARDQQRNEGFRDQDGPGSVYGEARGQRGRRDPRERRLGREVLRGPGFRVAGSPVEDPGGVDQEIEPPVRARDGLRGGVDRRKARDVEGEDGQPREGRGGAPGSRCLGLGRELCEGGRGGGVAAGGDNGVELVASSQDELAGELEAQACFYLFIYYYYHYHYYLGALVEVGRRS